MNKDRHQLAVEAATLNGLAQALTALTWEDDAKDQREHPGAVPALIRTINQQSKDLIEEIEQGDFSEGSNA